MKKSLVEKIEEARSASLKYKDTVYYVMDKKRKSAVCFCSELAFWKYFNEGYYPVTRFLNGKDIGK